MSYPDPREDDPGYLDARADLHDRERDARNDPSPPAQPCDPAISALFAELFPPVNPPDEPF